MIALGSLTGEIPFKKRTKNKRIRHNLSINSKIFGKGVTNCGQGEISGRTNLKNMKVNYWTNSTYVTNPDGTKHYFKRIEVENEYNGSTDYLQKTIKLDGVATRYKTDGHLLIRARLLTHENESAN
ncbi:MAG: hypothetical protein H0T62_02380 [Parachlamydiaceae bacterium]|nr:hypothetical protein [Parachlamydiaceae bacterium]